MIRALYRRYLALRRWLRGRRRRELAMKLETLDTLDAVRQQQEEKLRDSGEWDLDLASLSEAARTPKQLPVASCPLSVGSSSQTTDNRQPTTPPVLDAYEDGTCWRVWCRYCQHWHRHSRVAGHRVAHCSAADSPYHRTGYTLRFAGAWGDAPRHERARGES